MIDEFEPSNQILQAAVCMSSPGLVRPHTWHAGMEGLLVSLRMCQNLFLAGEHMWIYCLFWEQKGTSILTNFLRGTKARVAQHPRKRLPPTSHTLEEANLGAEPSYGMGMCHKSVQMHPGKKTKEETHYATMYGLFFWNPWCFEMSNMCWHFTGAPLPRCRLVRKTVNRLQVSRCWPPPFRGGSEHGKKKLGDV